ncbi:putative membrane protein [Rhodopirellula maiorica SM1]|uniref:Putative membrane protein n=1 Tax=Rhodopirellula maiorica SM1 TaxID=1265738 RepID=M5RP76_9BACT|nr:DUF6580 family putative transport protein [Rhodopirellula maiorica]EMI21011.1 putative membrane protein [Rhodopirellula maiorica SM1]
MFYLMILAVAASRFLPHPPNVACVAALGLFAGSYMSGRRAYLVPIGVMGLSDVVGHMLGIPGLGFYNLAAMSMVYLGMAASVPIGRKLRNASGTSRLWKIPAASLAASTVFFVVSNFGTILAGWYPMSVAGFTACYINAIPFYGFTVAGDLCFSVVIFAAYELSRARFYTPAMAKA